MHDAGRPEHNMPHGGARRLALYALARAPPRERHGTRYVEMSDDESHDEGLLLSPQQLDDVFRGLSNDTLSGL